MRYRRMILTSKWQVNLVHKSLKVLQFLPLHFVAVGSIKYLAPFLVGKLTCLVLVLRDMRAGLSVESSSVPRPVYTKLKVVKLTSFSRAHRCSFVRLSVLQKRVRVAHFQRTG